MNSQVNKTITGGLTSFLKQQKDAGRSIVQAVQAVKEEYLNSVFGVEVVKVLAVSHPEVGYIVRPSFLGASLAQVYVEEITPLTLAQSLKLVFQNANDVALGVAHGYPALTSTEIGAILLNETIYPDLSSQQMSGALSFAGFNDVDTQTAIDNLYGSKSNFTVDAFPKWQNSGVTVDAGETVHIQYTSGRWTANPSTGFVTASGNSRYKAKPGYTLPGAYEGLLCGKVGTTVFAVGSGTTVPPGLQGALEFCINDDLRGIYGAGFSDNEGAVVVNITEKKS